MCLNFLTPTQLAKKLDVPLSWIYRRSRERGAGSIPVIRVGKYLRFNEKEVDAWLRKQGGKENE
jgi:excisionase family DNA binding protein